MALFACAALFVISVLVAQRSLWGALVLCTFLAPWQGLDVDVGLRLTAYLVAVAGSVLVVITKPRVPLNSSSARHNYEMVAVFIGFAIALSIFHLPFLPHKDVAGGAARGPQLRAILQIPRLLLSLAPILLARRLPLSLRGITKLGRVYVLSCVVLAGVGWFQIGVWYATGRNPIPIGLVHSVLTGAGREATRDAWIPFRGAHIYRMNSFGGEPRHLGQALVVGMLLIEIAWVVRAGRKTGWNMVVWALLFVSALATGSTSAIYLWLMGTGLLIGLRTVVRPPGIRRFTRWTSGALLGTSLATVGIALLVNYAGHPGLTYATSLLRDRTLDRVLFEDTDAATVEMLENNTRVLLTGTGVGNAHLYVDPYVDPRFWHYLHDTSFVARSQWLRWLSELGVGGLGLFIAMCFSVILDLGRKSRAHTLPPATRSACAMMALAISVLSVGFLARHSVAELFYLALALGLSTANRSFTGPSLCHGYLASRHPVIQRRVRNP